MSDACLIHRPLTGAGQAVAAVLLTAQMLCAPPAAAQQEEPCSSELLVEQRRLLGVPIADEATDAVTDAVVDESATRSGARDAAQQPVEDVGIRLQIGDKVLRADTGQLKPRDDGSNDWVLSNALMLLPPYLFRVKEMRVNEQSGEVVGTDIQFWRGGTLSGAADSLRTRINLGDEEGDKLTVPVDIESFRISLCGDIKAPGWGLRGRSLQLDPVSVLARVRGVSLRFLGVPLPGPPLARLPLDGRSVSGFLVPVVNLLDDNNGDFALPYLLPLGRSADLTLVPRSVEDVGTGLESELRYLGNINSGTLLLATLDREQGSNLSALHWRHLLRPAPNLRLDVDYTEADRTLVSTYRTAYVSIPSRGGLNRQSVRGSYRASPLTLTLLSERYEGPFDGTFGDYRKDLEGRVQLQRRNALWHWNLALESGQFGYGRQTLFLNQQAADRPLQTAAAVERTLASGSVALRPEASWGWAQLQFEAAQIRQNVAGRQRSSSLLMAGGLRLSNASGSVYLEPGLSYRAVDFSAAGQLQNLDSSLFPASAVRQLGTVAAGSDILLAQDHLGLKLDLRYRGPGLLRMTAAAQLNHWGAAAKDSLLLAIAPELRAEEQTGAVSFGLNHGRHRLGVDHSQGKRLYDNSNRLSYRWSNSLLSLSLGRFQRDQGGGRNDRLDYDYLSLGLQLTNAWRISGYTNTDRQRDRETSHGFTLRYNSCCIAFHISMSDYLYTNYSRVSSAHWLNWESLPVRESSRISFSLQLKTGF